MSEDAMEMENEMDDNQGLEEKPSEKRVGKKTAQAEFDSESPDAEESTVNARAAKPKKPKKKGAGVKGRVRAGVIGQPSTMYYMHAIMLLGGRIVGSMLDFYNNLFSLTPGDNAKIYRNVSRHYMSKGLQQKAIDSLKEWSRLEPDNPEPPYQLALALASVGKTKQAIIVLNKVLEMQPDNIAAIYRRSKLLIKRKEYDKAVEGLKIVLEKNESDPEIYYLLGITYSRQDQLQDAVSALEKAVELDGEESKYHQHLGFLYERAGKHEKAAVCFSHVMELEDEDEDE